MSKKTVYKRSRATFRRSASFRMREAAAIDRQLAFDAVAIRAEQLQIVVLRATALGDGDDVIQHGIFYSAAIGAAVAVFRRQALIPIRITGAQDLPFTPLELRRHCPLVRA